MSRLKHLSLFSGIGGFDLAAEWAGIETVGQCEIDPFCQGVLRKHWPDIKLWGDIRNVTKEEVEKHCGSIGIITGGFPCQPVSAAGQRKGTEDDRWLWPEMLRVIREVRPRWVVAENVAGIGYLVESGRFIDMEGQVVEEDKFDEATELVLLERTWNDLEAAGYEVQPVSIPACGCSAWHERQRVFIIAHSSSGRREERTPFGQTPNDIGQEVGPRVASDTNGVGRVGNDGDIREGRSVVDGGQIPATDNEDGGERQPGIEPLASAYADPRGDAQGTAHGAGSEGDKHGKQDHGSVVGNDIGNRGEAITDRKGGKPRKPKARDGRKGIERRSPVVADAASKRLHNKENKQGLEGEGRDQLRFEQSGSDGNYWWAVEPAVARMVYGVPDRVDRVRSLGNAVAPQVAYRILKAIVEVENGQG